MNGYNFKIDLSRYSWYSLLILCGGLGLFTTTTAACAGQYHFELLKGEGIEVCEAYLKRLNQMEFEWPPYCFRPQDKGENGFSALKTEKLDANEIYKFYDKVKNFFSTRNQYQTRRIPGTKQRVSKTYLFESKEKSIKYITSMIGSRQLSVKRYRGDVDIDNDGKIDKVVQWREGRCGDPKFLPRVWLYIITDKNTVDEEKMLSVLLNEDPKWKAGPELQRFKFLDHSAGVFLFKSKTYIDTYPGGYNMDGEKIKDVDLRVYTHEKGKTKLNCVYNEIKGAE